MRKTHQTLWLAVLAASGLLAQLVQAQQKAVQPRQPETSQPVGVYARRHALCIGINDYASPAIPDLSYAEADAREVADVLRALYGFDDMTLLAGRQASKAAINAAIASLFDPGRVGPGDAVVIFFSGHGQTVKQGRSEVGYLIPQDAKLELARVVNPAPYRQYAVRMDDLRSDADGIPAKHVLFLIDACYSGYLSSKAIEAPPAIASALKYPARQVITAGTAGEQAVEHNAWGHGAFTYKMLEILRAERGPLQASRLGVMLKERVPREVAARFGSARMLSPQAKYLSGDGDFLFVRPGTSLDLPQEPPTHDPVSLLKQGDRRVIEDLVSRGQFRAATDRLGQYERTYGSDEFSAKLKPALQRRAASVDLPLIGTNPVAKPPSSQPASSEETRRVIENLVISGQFQAAIDRLGQYERTYGADEFSGRLKPALQRRAASVNLPLIETNPVPKPPNFQPASSKEISIVLSSPGGVAPFYLHFSVQIPPSLGKGTDCLWLHNGEPICTGIKGLKILRTPGQHRIEALVTTADRRQFRAYRTVIVQPKAPPRR